MTATGTLGPGAPAPESVYHPALVDRLLTVIGGINAELDHDLVLGRICRACVDLVGSDAAGFVTFDQQQARFTAGVGFGAEAMGMAVAFDAEALASIAADPQRLVVHDVQEDLGDRPDVVAALGGRRTLVMLPVLARGQLAGGLIVLFEPPGHQLTAEQWAVLDLLAGHGGAAIANAVAFEAALRREAHEQAVIDAVADGIATLDETGRVTGWSRTAMLLTGVPRDAVLGEPLPFPVGTPDDPAEHVAGDGRHLEIVATELDRGQVVALRDVSRQKALEAAKAIFVAATSHELKTPLTVIKSMAEWLREGGETVDGSRRRTAYEAIATSADELYRIVEKVLLTAKTEAGYTDLRPTVLDPGRLVRGAAAPFDFPGGQHELVVEADDDLPAVWADQQATRTAMGLLLENAVKYTPDGGEITVSVQPLTEPASGEAQVRFAVRDQGIGLAPGEEEYLFMPFYQGETHIRIGVHGGVGLGLSIVRRLVEAQGGRVGASGAPGEGAEFWFTLPAADADHDDLV